MSVAGTVRRTLERLTGLRIASRLPRGVDLFRDLREALPPLEVRTVLDVGANVGQSARDYLRHWPHARIHCFEPVTATFDALVRNLAGDPRVRCHRVALGSSEGGGRMVLDGTSRSRRCATNSPTTATCCSASTIRRRNGRRVPRTCDVPIPSSCRRASREAAWPDGGSSVVAEGRLVPEEPGEAPGHDKP